MVKAPVKKAVNRTRDCSPLTTCSKNTALIIPLNPSQGNGTCPVHVRTCNHRRHFFRLFHAACCGAIRGDVVSQLEPRGKARYTLLPLAWRKRHMIAPCAVSSSGAAVERVPLKRAHVYIHIAEAPPRTSSATLGQRLRRRRDPAARRNVTSR